MLHKGVFDCVFSTASGLTQWGSYMPGHMKRCPTLWNSPPKPKARSGAEVLLRDVSVYFCVGGWGARKSQVSFLFLLSISCSGSIGSYEKGPGEKKKRGRRQRRRRNIQLPAMRTAIFWCKLPGSSIAAEVPHCPLMCTVNDVHAVVWLLKCGAFAATTKKQLLVLFIACVFIPIIMRKKMLCCFPRNSSDAPLARDLIGRGGGDVMQWEAGGGSVYQWSGHSWWKHGYGSSSRKARFLFYTKPFPV